MRVDVIDTMPGLIQAKDNWEMVYRADPEAQYFLCWTWIATWFESLSEGSWLVLAAKADHGSGDYVAFFLSGYLHSLIQTARFRMRSEWEDRTLPSIPDLYAIRSMSIRQ